MAINVNEPPNPIPWVHSCPVVLEEATAPVIDPETMKRMLESQRETARRRPNPAHGAPMPKGVRFFA